MEYCHLGHSIYITNDINMYKLPSKYIESNYWVVSNNTSDMDDIITALNKK